MMKDLKSIVSSRWIIFIFVVAIILSGCQKRCQQEQDLVKPADGIEKFLRHAMITHSGVYTLVGLKPITGFSNLTVEPSQERLKKIYENLSARARAINSFEDVSFHFREAFELWNDWSKVKSEYLGENFLFFADPRIPNHVVFVNLAAVALVLEENYEDFKKVYGQDFDPTEIVFSIDSGDSVFWKTCFKDHYLSGLLYGFGKENSKLFSWEMVNKKPGKARSDSCSQSPVVNNPSISQLLPPSFVVYSPLDEKLLLYKSMREEIIKLYDGKDFKEVTLKLLSDTERSLSDLMDRRIHALSSSKNDAGE